MPRLVQYLAFLPYARLICLLLAASQLMPLPDEPESRFDQALGIIAFGPDPLVRETTLGRRDSYAA